MLERRSGPPGHDRPLPPISPQGVVAQRTRPPRPRRPAGARRRKNSAGLPATATRHPARRAEPEASRMRSIRARARAPDRPFPPPGGGRTQSPGRSGAGDDRPRPPRGKAGSAERAGSPESGLPRWLSMRLVHRSTPHRPPRARPLRTHPSQSSPLSESPRSQPRALRARAGSAASAQTTPVSSTAGASFVVRRPGAPLERRLPFWRSRGGQFGRDRLAGAAPTLDISEGCGVSGRAAQGLLAQGPA